MKIFGLKFFYGVSIVALGWFGVIMGVFMSLSPLGNLFFGITAVIMGIVLIRTGIVVVRDRPPRASDVEVDTLRRAGMLDKDH